MEHKGYSLLALAFFIVLFMLFILFQPQITGHAVSIDSANLPLQTTDTLVEGTITLTLEEALSDQAQLTINISNQTLYSQNTTLLTSIPGYTPRQSGSFPLRLEYFGLKVSTPGTHFLNIALTDNGQEQAASQTTLPFLGILQLRVFTDNEDNTFKNNDTISCYFQHPGLGTPTTFYYKPTDSRGTPSYTINQHSTLCDPQSLGDCYTYSELHVTATSLGQWNCAVTLTYQGKTATKFSNKTATMENTAPTLTRGIGSMNLSSQENITINLDELFQDFDNDRLQFRVVGNNLSQAFIDGDQLILSNPQDFSGTDELILIASDGFEDVSANFTLELLGGNAPPQPEEQLQQQPRIIRQPEEQLQQQLTLSQLELPEIPEASELGVLPIILLSLGGLIILGGAGLYFYQRGRTVAQVPSQEANAQQPQATAQQQPEIVQQQGQQPQAAQQAVENSHELQAYTDDALLNQSKRPDQARQELLQAGWQSQDVERALSLSGAKKFVKDKLSAGFASEQIKQTLRQKKWKDDLIEKIFNDLKK